MFVDTHAHLEDEKLIKNIDEILLDAYNNGVEKIVCASYDLASSQLATQISDTYQNVYATIGVHPHDAKTYSKETEQTLIQLSKNKKVVAVGEIGLDYHYDLSPRDIQKQVFEKQILLAYKLGLPIVIHMREATQDTLEILEKNKQYIIRAVLHCFNGSKQTLDKIMSMGFYVSYGGAVTFKNANGLLDIVKATPLDRIMLETDCPYMTPVPYRGQPNMPKYIPLVAEKICELKNISINQLQEITTKNAEKFFNLTQK